MRNILIILVAVLGLVSCGNSGKSTAPKEPEGDRVEVIYFHGKKRCPTCTAIEKNTAELASTLLADEVKGGSVVFRIVDITTPDGEAIADRYEVAWSSLFVNKWENGHESRNDMTEFGFRYARNDPDGFKKGLEAKIRQLMK